ncbi:hypothetical protein ACFLXJ_03145 [Chloroflexota bacterium]
MTEQFGLEGIWEDLSNNLIVSVNTYEDSSSTSELPIVTEFTVTNGAPQSDNRPDIFFEEVVLAVGVPPDLHVEKHKGLVSGESFEYKHRSSYSDLGRIVYSVEGTVSPEYLLKVKREARNVPSRVASLSIASYVRVLKDIDIHKWMKGVIEGMSIPGPDTTEAEIAVLKDRLQNASREISSTKAQLQNTLRFIARPKDEEKRKVNEHERILDKYLTNTIRACSDLQKMLDTLNSKTLSANRDSIVASLMKEASQLDVATEGLLSKE